MAEVARELSGVSFTRAPIPFVRTPPSDLITSQRPTSKYHKIGEGSDNDTRTFTPLRGARRTDATRLAKC